MNWKSNAARAAAKLRSVHMLSYAQAIAVARSPAECMIAAKLASGYATASLTCVHGRYQQTGDPSLGKLSADIADAMASIQETYDACCSCSSLLVESFEVLEA